jgi:hypothetical protein
MADDNTLLYTAVYEDLSTALADLSAVEQRHQDERIGKFDAAVIDRRTTSHTSPRDLTNREFVRFPRRSGRNPAARGAPPRCREGDRCQPGRTGRHRRTGP